MAYVPANLQKLAGSGPTATQLWTFKGVDSLATIKGAGFITDGSARGMRVGDQVIYSDTNTPLTSLVTVSAVTAGGAATVVA